jgi:hypothetical protein
VIEHQILALRQEAEELDKLGHEYEGLAPSVERTTAIILFRGMAAAKRNTADALEQGSRNG